MNLLTLFVSTLHAYGVSYSTYPFAPATKILAVDVGGKNGSMATQFRLGYKYNEQVMFEGGLGVAMSGNDNANMFVGIDYEIIPDYLRQPRVGLKVAIDNNNLTSNRQSIFSITPTVSKGLSFWGKEAFPYVAIPMGMAFSANNTYSTYFAMNMGITGNLPFNNYQHIVANLEASLGLTGLSSYLFAGFSFPFKESLVFKE